MASKLIKKRKNMVEEVAPTLTPESSDDELDESMLVVDHTDYNTVAEAAITDNTPINTMAASSLPPRSLCVVQTKKMAEFIWSKEEDALLTLLVSHAETWQEISKQIPNKTPRQCRVRWRRLTPDPAVKAGAWTLEEDAKVLQLVAKYNNAWRSMAKEMGTRTSEQIRGRYMIALNPDRNRDRETKGWTDEEHTIMIRAYSQFGSKWVEMARLLPGRVSKQVGSHYLETVGPKLEIFLQHVNKPDYWALSEAEHADMLAYLQIKRTNRSSSIDSVLEKWRAKQQRKKARYNANGALITEQSPYGGNHRLSVGRSAAAQSATLVEANGDDRADHGDDDSVDGERAPTAAAAIPDTDVNSSGSSSAQIHPQLSPPVVSEIQPSLSSSSLQHVSAAIDVQLEGGEEQQEEQPQEIGEEKEEEEYFMLTDFKKARRISKVRWTVEEDVLLESLVQNKKAWNDIAREMTEKLGTHKTIRQCQVRWKVHLNPEIKLGAFTPEEDALLTELIVRFGHNWKEMSQSFKQRTPEQLRGRHNNLLRIEQARLNKSLPLQSPLLPTVAADEDDAEERRDATVSPENNNNTILDATTSTATSV